MHNIGIGTPLKRHSRKPSQHLLYSEGFKRVYFQDLAPITPREASVDVDLFVDAILGQSTEREGHKNVLDFRPVKPHLRRTFLPDSVSGHA